MPSEPRSRVILSISICFEFKSSIQSARAATAGLETCAMFLLRFAERLCDEFVAIGVNPWEKRPRGTPGVGGGGLRPYRSRETGVGLIVAVAESGFNSCI